MASALHFQSRPAQESVARQMRSYLRIDGRLFEMLILEGAQPA